MPRHAIASVLLFVCLCFTVGCAHLAAVPHQPEATQVRAQPEPQLQMAVPADWIRQDMSLDPASDGVAVVLRDTKSPASIAISLYPAGQEPEKVAAIAHALLEASGTTVLPPSVAADGSLVSFDLVSPDRTRRGRVMVMKFGGDKRGLTVMIQGRWPVENREAPTIFQTVCDSVRFVAPQ